MKSKIKQKFPQIDKLQGRPPVTTLKKIKNRKSANTISALPIPKNYFPFCIKTLFLFFYCGLALICHYLY